MRLRSDCEGCARAAAGRSFPIGINLGKSKTTPLEKAAEDYLHSFRRLREFADYLVLNVSSPNTPGLRSLQEHEALAKLLGAMQRENARGPRKPVLLKIAPDLGDDDLGQIIATLRGARNCRHYRDQHHARSPRARGRAGRDRRPERSAVAGARD